MKPVLQMQLVRELVEILFLLYFFTVFRFGLLWHWPSYICVDTHIQTYANKTYMCCLWNLGPYIALLTVLDAIPRTCAICWAKLVFFVKSGVIKSETVDCANLSAIYCCQYLL